MAKMLGRLGWRGQCSCCNGPKPKKAIRAEERRIFLTEDEFDEYLRQIPYVPEPDTTESAKDLK